MRLLEDRPGNPFGAAHHRTNGVMAFSCRANPAYYVNRIVGLGLDDSDLVGQLLSWYDPAAPSPTIELPPTALSRSLTRTLTQHGFTQSGVHATVAVAATAAVAVAATEAVAGDAGDVTVEQVTSPDDMAEFERVHLAGWGHRPRPEPANPNSAVRNWLTQPGWRLYLARCGGVPAGTAILYLTADVGYLASAATVPAWRGKGVQTALLRHRIAAAVAAGVDVVFGEAEYLSTSYRNMLRAGIPLLYNQSMWTRD
jgi:GNAT superfamily N-acetyltransferase